MTKLMALVENQAAQRNMMEVVDNVIVAADEQSLYEIDDRGQLELRADLPESGTEFVLALGPGNEALRDKLALTLGDVNCTWLDLNQPPESMQVAQLAKVFRQRKNMWSDEVFQFGDLPPEPPQFAYKTGFAGLDRHGFRVTKPAFMPVIGPYGSGKSVLLRQLAVNMFKLYGWRTLCTTFEEKPARFERDFRNHLSRWIGPHTDPNGDTVTREIREAFRGLRRKRGDMMDTERLVDRIDYAARVYGVDMVIIDPVNEVDHVVSKGESKTDYMARFIMELKHLADDHNILMVCAAHPPKDGGAKRSSTHVYTLNDGADTAHYGNKADIGWCVWRPNLQDRRTFLNIDKCKDTEVMGQPTYAKMMLSPNTGAFEVMATGPEVLSEIKGE